MYENMIQYHGNMMTMMKDLLERLIAHYHYLKRMINIDLTMMMIDILSGRFASSAHLSELV